MLQACLFSDNKLNNAFPAEGRPCMRGPCSLHPELSSSLCFACCCTEDWWRDEERQGVLTKRSHLSLIKNDRRERRARSPLDTAVLIQTYTCTHTQITPGIPDKGGLPVCHGNLQHGKTKKELPTLLGSFNSVCETKGQKALGSVLQE